MTKRPFMRLFTADWRDGTRALSFEERGFYLLIITHLHDGDVVPSEPRALGVFLQCDPRMASRLVDSLLKKGKLYARDGRLGNERVDRDIAETSQRSQGEVSRKKSEKPTKSDTAKTHHIHIHNQIEKNNNRSEQAARVEDDRSTAEFVECKTAFNGSTEKMLQAVQNAMGPMANRRNAENWLAGLLRINGQLAVAEAFQMALSAEGSGQPIVKLLPWWSKTAASLKAKQPALKPNKPYKPSRWAGVPN